MASISQELSSSDYAAIYKARRSHKINRQERDLSRLDEQTAHFLQLDRQQLQAEQEQARQNRQSNLARQFTLRLIKHYIIDDFFFSLAEAGQSTRLPDITPDDIEAFLHRQRPLRGYKGKPTLDSMTGYPEAKRVEKTELNEFFIRAVQAEWAVSNPVEPLVRRPSRLTPEQPSLQTQADLKTFLEYLEDRVAYNRLSPATQDNFFRTFRTLLYDAEVAHRLDPAWPTALDGIFSQPRWVYDWLRKSKNRSISSRSETLARDTILRRLGAVRHMYLFLKRQGRVAEPYFKELLGLFTFEDGSKFIPGRPAREIGALSEAEEQRVFDCIAQHSQKSALRLRDQAMITTAITTTIRIDGLNSMRIENFKEIEPGIWTCYVKTKRSGQKNSDSHLRLAEDHYEWRDWYMSPAARAAIQAYLSATGRDWHSTGPVWLTYRHQPLSYGQQQNVIRQWLRLARCTYTNPHALRHTGIERLVNKEALPIPVVQQISQHADPAVLLKVYAKGARVDAYRLVNRVFMAPDQEEGTGFERMILSISTTLAELSARIHRRAQERGVLRREHAEELLEILRQQSDRLAKSLGNEAMSEGVLLSTEAYRRIGDTLNLYGLNYERVIGYEPKPQKQTVLKPMGRKPKLLLA